MNPAHAATSPQSGPLLLFVVDDEPDILEIIQYNLRSEGYEVATAADGDDGLQKAKTFKPDLIILDVMMPFLNGFEACRQLRQIPNFQKTLIIFLTALSDETTEVKGLESGADDYISKPIRPKALISKVNSLFRRVSEMGKEKNRSEELIIDRERFSVFYRNTEISLARKEFELLALLASKPGKVFLRNEILSQIWGTEVIVGDRTIDVHIRKIRQKK